MSLGNQKPELLRQVEQSLWRTLLRISSGQHLGDEIGTFLDEYMPVFRRPSLHHQLGGWIGLLGVSHVNIITCAPVLHEQSYFAEPPAPHASTTEIHTAPPTPSQGGPVSATLSVSSQFHLMHSTKVCLPAGISEGC